ncbi:hypothetical protein KCU73_g8728, partial [Aureobasidium melanogenum]
MNENDDCKAAQNAATHSATPRLSGPDRPFSRCQSPQHNAHTGHSQTAFSHQGNLATSSQQSPQPHVYFSHTQPHIARTPHYGFPQLDPYSTHILQQQDKEHKQKEGQRQRGVVTGLHQRSSTDESHPNRNPRRQKADGHSVPDMASAGLAGDPYSSTWAPEYTAPAVTSVTGGWQSSSTSPVDVSKQDSVDGSTHASATVHGVSSWALSNVKNQVDAFTFSDRDVQHAGQSHGYFQPEIEQGWDTAFQSLVEPDSTVCGPTMPTSNWDYKPTSNATELQRFNAHSCQETTPTSKPQEGKSADDSPRQEPKDAGDGFQSATQGNIINARANHRAATSPDETIYQPQLHLRREADKLHV